MAAIRQRRKKDGTIRFLVQVRVKGHPPETATFDHRKDAKLWGQRTEAALREGRYFPTREAKRRTVAELIDAYSADAFNHLAETDRRNRCRQLAWWKRQLGIRPLADVTPPRIADCLRSLQQGDSPSGERVGPATRNRYLAALSAAFRWVMAPERGWTDTNPARRLARLSEPDGRVRFLSADECRDLLAAAKANDSPRIHPLVVLALATGARETELMRLRWTNVDLANGFLRITKTKNRDPKTCPVRGLALETLRDWARSQVRTLGGDYVFGKPGVVYSPAGPHFPRKRWETVRDAAHLQDFRFHDLRHTTGSYLAMSGATEREIMEVLGHRTAVMARRYSHLSPQHVAGVVERMVNQFM
jgi:integrase